MVFCGSTLRQSLAVDCARSSDIVGGFSAAGVRQIARHSSAPMCFIDKHPFTQGDRTKHLFTPNSIRVENESPPHAARNISPPNNLPRVINTGCRYGGPAAIHRNVVLKLLHFAPSLSVNEGSLAALRWSSP